MELSILQLCEELFNLKNKVILGIQLFVTQLRSTRKSTSDQRSSLGRFQTIQIASENQDDFEELLIPIEEGKFITCNATFLKML